MRKNELTTCNFFSVPFFLQDMVPLGCAICTCV
jgi:hypothetical protein